MLAFVRRLATAPGFHRLTHFGPFLRVSFALRAVLVRSPLRFALNELRHRGEPAVYELRAAPVRVALRHGTPDVLVLDEIFSQREYTIPTEVRGALASCPRPAVVDVGANIGLFGAFIFTEYPNAQVVAIEADPENAIVHEQTIAGNRGRDWELVGAYAGTAEGTTRFEGGGFSVSRASKNGTGIEVRSVDAFAYLGRADLIKIDIEGGEWPLLADERFESLPARVVVLAYHVEGCPSGDPRGDAEGALRRAGFVVVPGPAKPELGAGVLWGVRAVG
jgi:FkbM family methyltransferase